MAKTRRRRLTARKRVAASTLHTGGFNFFHHGSRKTKKMAPWDAALYSQRGVDPPERAGDRLARMSPWIIVGIPAIVVCVLITIFVSDLLIRLTSAVVAVVTFWAIIKLIWSPSAGQRRLDDAIQTAEEEAQDSGEGGHRGSGVEEDALGDRRGDRGLSEDVDEGEDSSTRDGVSLPGHVAQASRTER